MTRTPATEPEPFSRSHPGAGEKGYVLLSLLVMMALLVIVAAAAAPKIAEQIRREREEELIHRAMQYRRAIRTFAKRTGRFPLRLEELENTDGTRYLRKRYKDPITGGEFRLLHPEDVQASGARLASNSSDQNTNGGQDQSGLNQSGLNQASLNQSISQAASSGDTTAAQLASADSPEASLPSGGSTASSLGPSVALQSAAFNSSLNGPAGNISSNSTGGSAPLVHGGLILGVASRSTKKTFREFEHKTRYSQWLFFYSAIYDGSFEVKGPTPTSPIFPKLQNAPGTPAGVQPGQPSP
jgi:type II secretory pathway pseudopilin PulG